MCFELKVPPLQTFSCWYWAQLESRVGPSCYHTWPQSCTPSSTASLYRRTGAWVNVFYCILTFHTDLSVSYLFICRDFFLGSAAGHLIFSVGWDCRSPPVLEILGLQPWLHLLRLSLHAIVVTLAGLGRATPISYVFKVSSTFLLFPPHCTAMCCVGHRPSSVFHNGDLVQWYLL